MQTNLKIIKILKKDIKMPKLQKQRNGSYSVVLPLEFIERLTWKKGEKLIINLVNDSELKISKL
jgi:hypothetical protein